MGEEELLDVYNDNMELIGIKKRSEVHSNGYWHKSFHCWVIHKKENKKYVLFQRRGPQKKLYPNTLDITAAGHYVKGETIEDGIRELNEELGINAKYSDLIYLGIRCDVAIIGDVTNREFCDVYLFESPLDINEYNLQEDEVAGIVEISLEDGLKLFACEVDEIKIRGMMLENGEKKENLFNITLSDVIPRQDRYYLKVFIMAERYFEGLKYVAI